VVMMGLSIVVVFIISYPFGDAAVVDDARLNLLHVWSANMGLGRLFYLVFVFYAILSLYSPF